MQGRTAVEDFVGLHAVEAAQQGGSQFARGAVEDHAALVQGDHARAVAHGHVHLVQRDHDGAAVLAVDAGEDLHQPCAKPQDRARQSVRRPAPPSRPAPACGRWRRAAAGRPRAWRRAGRGIRRCRRGPGPSIASARSCGVNQRVQARHQGMPCRRPTSTLTITGRRSTRLNCWNTKPIYERILRTSRWMRPSRCTHWPETSITEPGVPSAAIRPATWRKQGRLARTGRTDQRHHLAGADVEVHVVERELAAGEALAEVLDAKG